jgi:hypothetical protein
MTLVHEPQRQNVGRSLPALVFLVASILIMFFGLSSLRAQLSTPSCEAALQRVAEVRGDGWPAMKLQLMALPPHCGFEARD